MVLRSGKPFDTHCHTNDPRYDEDRTQVLRAMRADLSGAICVGFDLASSAMAVKQAQENDFLYAAAGVHPEETYTLTDADEARLEAMLDEERVVALGEIGLDYHGEEVHREVQQDWFVRQMELAVRKDLPVCIHLRDAYEDMLRILRARKGHLPAGVMHCFSGSVETAREALDMGFYISFAGAVTFKNARHLPDVARFVPLDRLLIETDSPYLTPAPHRGERNHPCYVAHIAEKIAEIKGLPLDELIGHTNENTLSCFPKIKEV